MEVIKLMTQCHQNSTSYIMLMTNTWGYTSKINVSTWDQIIPIMFTWNINAFQVAVSKVTQSSMLWRVFIVR